MHGNVSGSAVPSGSGKTLAAPLNIECLSIASSDSEIEIICEKPAKLSNALWAPSKSQGPQKKEPPVSGEDVPTEHQIFILDLEATSRNPSKARIIDLALIEKDTQQTYTSLVNPGISIRREIQSLTGISNSDVKGKFPAPDIRVVLGSMLAFMDSHRIPGKTPVLVAHHGKAYDFRLLTEEAARCSFSLPPDLMCIDTLLLSKATEIKLKERSDNLKQGTLRVFFNIPPPPQEHRALPDACVLREIYEALMTREVLPKSKSSNLQDVFSRVGAANALFPLCSISPRPEVVDKRLAVGLDSELAALGPGYSYLDDIGTSLNSYLKVGLKTIGPIRDANHRKICFLVRGASIKYPLSSNLYAYKVTHDPDWKMKLFKSRDAQLALLAAVGFAGLEGQKELPVLISCVKEVRGGLLSWKLETQIIDLTTERMASIQINLEGCRLDSTELENIKKKNLEIVDERLRGKRVDVLIEASAYNYHVPGIKLKALRIFIS